MDCIRFYKTDKEYGYFSNFARYSILADSFVWPTTEHYFQASKFNDPEVKEKFRAITSPFDVAQEGRKRNYILRDDWEQVKDDVMRKALKAKFLQHHELKIKLLQTNGSTLCEHTANDSYWADGGDGSGKNMLGVLLMELRDDIMRRYPNADWVLPPWIAFPGVDDHDMFWRMGLGEDYMYKWASWFNPQPREIKEQYQQLFPAPAEGSWEGFYG